MDQIQSFCEKCPYSELFWSVFCRIWTEYGEVLMRENTDQNNSEYGHFLRSEFVIGAPYIKEKRKEIKQNIA